MKIERRRQKRLSISAEAMLTVLIPEVTFSPNSVRAVATDISTSGVKVKSYQLNKNDYHELIKGVNYAKLVAELPYLEEPIDLRGRVVWVEFHEKEAAEPAYVVLGMKFERLPDHIQVRLEYVIDRLGADAVDTASSQRKSRPGDDAT